MAREYFSVNHLCGIWLRLNQIGKSYTRQHPSHVMENGRNFSGDIITIYSGFQGFSMCIHWGIRMIDCCHDDVI